MKTYRVWKWMLVTGKKSELDKIAQVAEGTHHVHRNQKGGPRKRKQEVTSSGYHLPESHLPGEGGSHVSD
jgi:hypothetical protein